VRLWFEIRGAPLTTRTTEEWLRIFRDADIAAMPCHTVETLQNDQHLYAVGLFGREEHPTEGETITLRSSIIVDGKTATTTGAPQPKGWESADIAAELGFTAEQIETLLAGTTLISNR
jgi:crotonobetainyl-CoA:carnitine CoA-transferase CaiB-like acyl-CoA transferase